MLLEQILPRNLRDRRATRKLQKESTLAKWSEARTDNASCCSIPRGARPSLWSRAEGISQGNMQLPARRFVFQSYNLVPMLYWLLTFEELIEADGSIQHDADRRPHRPCAGQPQTDHHSQACRSSHDIIGVSRLASCAGARPFCHARRRCSGGPRAARSATACSSVKARLPQAL